MNSIYNDRSMFARRSQRKYIRRALCLEVREWTRRGTENFVNWMEYTLWKIATRYRCHQRRRWAREFDSGEDKIHGTRHYTKQNFLAKQDDVFEKLAKTTVQTVPYVTRRYQWSTQRKKSRQEQFSPMHESGGFGLGKETTRTSGGGKTNFTSLKERGGTTRKLTPRGDNKLKALAGAYEKNLCPVEVFSEPETCDPPSEPRPSYNKTALNETENIAVKDEAFWLAREHLNTSHINVCYGGAWNTREKTCFTQGFADPLENPWA